MTDISCKADRFGKYVAASHKVATVSHTHPDGDALGSSVAVKSWLDSLGKEAKCIFPDAIGSNISFISEDLSQSDIIIWSEDAQGARKWIEGCDLLIVLDMNSLSRSGAMESFLSSLKIPRILIDHHLSPETSQFCLLISETEVSSASELVFWTLDKLISKGLGSLSLAASNALMAGMTTDTNNFANSTWPTTLKMASMLLEAGVDRDKIVERINWNYSENRLRVLGFLLLQRLTLTPEDTAYMILSQDDVKKYSLSEGDTEGFVNMPLAVSSVRMSIFLKEDKDYFRVSVRSKRGTSARDYAKLYCHGGGHENAAGGRILIPQDVRDSASVPAFLENTIKDYFNEKA